MLTPIKIALFLSKVTRIDLLDARTKYSARDGALNDTQKASGRLRVFGVVTKNLRCLAINFPQQA